VARFLFTIFDRAGHWAPFSSTIRRVLELGHEVMIATPGDLSQRLHELEHPVSYVQIGAGWKMSRDQSALLSRLSDPGWSRRYWHLALLSGARAQIDALTETCESFRPHIICTDPAFYAAPICAEKLGIPWTVISPNPLPLAPADCIFPLRTAFEALTPQIIELGAAHGVAMKVELGHAISPLLNVFFTIEELVGRPPAESFRFLGPARPTERKELADDFPWERLHDDRPIIYVTSGTEVFFDPQILDGIVGAIGMLGCQAVVSLPRVFDNPRYRTMPDHVVAARWVPALKLMRRANAVVCHGGASTMLESLDAGLPMIMIPMIYEQPLQARLAAEAGVAWTVTPETFSEREFRRRLGMILEDNNPIRRRAKEIGDLCRTMNGPHRAAELLSELAT
jgi:UDP:flavonoid glycosyltransferase YjiC (YdhE family)